MRRICLRDCGPVQSPRHCDVPGSVSGFHFQDRGYFPTTYGRYSKLYPVDVVTHGMMGVIVAAPFAAHYPEASAGLVIGSVLPDADALSRLLGKRNFLKWHQTFTHALPIIVSVAVVFYLVLYLCDIWAYRMAVGLGVGMTFHSLLDYSNTYGITLLAPFSQKRFCKEWIFFIDLPLIIVSAAPLIVVLRSLQIGKTVELWLAYSYVGFLIFYWVFRIGLHRRAWRLAPRNTNTLLPTAFYPWKFLGARATECKVHLFDLNAFDGTLSNEMLQEVHTSSYSKLLEQLPEYRTMCELSPLYHVTQVRTDDEGVVLSCRDLRTRNFNTRFGALTVFLDPAGAIERVQFHV